MWPSELIGFLYAMACTEDGRKALRGVDEAGIPHRGLRGIIHELKTGNGTASLSEMLRQYLGSMNVPVDSKIGVLASVGQYAERAAAAERRKGPLMSQARSLVSELYDCMRAPTISWPSERINNLVKCLGETMETMGT